MSDMISQISSSINLLEQEFSIIAHNLANVSTVGYKRRCNEFAKTMRDQGIGLQDVPIDESTPRSSIDFTQGHLLETNRSLDVALDGKGFFVIETIDGPLYTRNGMFHLNRNGQIVNSRGQIVSGQNGPISVPQDISPSQVNISPDGSISAPGMPIGKFKLVDFKKDEYMLTPVGTGCFRAPDSIKPGEPDKVVVRQGYQESSNVKMVDELVDMITVSRLYESNMKFAIAQKEVSSSIINVAMA